jgi:hypothetical protein
MASEYEKKTRTGQLILFLLLIAIAAVVIWRYYSSRPGSFLAQPAEYELQYMPADFRIEIDPENAIAIIQNPRRYRREFNDLVQAMNTGIIRHVANRMGLSDSLRTAALQAYENRHPYFADLYYEDFISIRDTSAELYETWYDNAGSGATDIFYEVAAKYTCFLLNDVLAVVIETDGGRIYARGEGLDTPCGIAMGEALQPMIERMRERAAIQDFSRSRGLLQEKVERVIAELATMEVRDKKGLNKNMQTKVWGFSVSETELEITAISILKVGFRLNDYFEVGFNEQANLVTITLPEPVILSHEVYPKIEKLDIGWMREVQEININEGINSLRSEFRREALASNIMDRSKNQATELMNTMFGPLVKSINNNYNLKVQFRRMDLEPDSETSPLPG